MIFLNKLHDYPVIVDECKTGDGMGGAESRVEDLLTRQECIAKAKSTPGANGATFDNPCQRVSYHCYKYYAA